MIDKLLTDLSIISKLGDNPNTDDGLSAQALKETFDQAGLTIQEYINSTLVPAIVEESADVAAIGAKVYRILKILNIEPITCTTPADSASKVIGIHGEQSMPVENYSDYWVIFKNGNTASDITLDIGEGAKRVVRNGGGEVGEIPKYYLCNIRPHENGWIWVNPTETADKDYVDTALAKKQNWATIKLTAFPEAASADTLHAWVNANHKGADRKWLVESSNPDFAALVASLGGAPNGASGNAFILLEIPYSEAGPEMLRAQYVLRNSQGIWDMTQYATYATTSPTWRSTGWVKEEQPQEAPQEVFTAVITNEVGRLVCDMTASEIINNSRKGIVKATYTDDTTGETRTYQYAKQMPDGRAVFDKPGYIEDGVTHQSLIYVDYAGNVTVETREPTATTVYATCTAEAAPSTSSPVTWYVPKTMPRPSRNTGMMVDVFWQNGRADGLGYDVTLVWGEEGGSDNETIIHTASVSSGLTGEYSIPAQGTVRYQLEETNGRERWKYVSGNLISRQFSTATPAATADKTVPGMAISYLPGMEIYVQLDEGNTAETMRLVPDEGATLPVYGNGTGAKTGDIPAGAILHLKNAGDHWQIINGGGSGGVIKWIEKEA